MISCKKNKKQKKNPAWPWHTAYLLLFGACRSPKGSPHDWFFPLRAGSLCLALAPGPIHTSVPLPTLWTRCLRSSVGSASYAWERGMSSVDRKSLSEHGPRKSLRWERGVCGGQLHLERSQWPWDLSTKIKSIILLTDSLAHRDRISVDPAGSIVSGCLWIDYILTNDRKVPHMV